jgi:purine nucleoside phosphorylase
MTAHGRAHAQPSHAAARSARIRWYAGLAVETLVLAFVVAVVLIAMSVL